MGRVVPPDQGLGADELAGAKVHDRLVVEHELGLVDGSAQVRFELEPDLDSFLHGRFEDDDSIATVVLGDRPGHFRHSKQAARIGLARRGRRNAHARGQIDEVAGDVHRLSDGSEDAVGRSQRYLWRRMIVQQDPELVPAEAGTGVGDPDRGSEATRDLLENLVAHVVPQILVDELESVQAHGEDGRVQLGACRARKRLPHPVVEQGAVWEVCQEVVQGELGELALERLAFPDVVRGKYDLPDRGVVQAIGGDRLDLTPDSGGIPKTPLDWLGDGSPGRHIRDEGPDSL